MRKTQDEIDELRAIAKAMLRADGDRDDGFKSNLNVEHVCAIAARLKEIANTLEAIT